MMGTCKECGNENVEVNEEGYCAADAAKMAAAGATPTTEGGDSPSTPSPM